MAGKEKVAIKRSDQFQEVDEELTQAMADLDCTIERVSAIFDGTVDEATPSEELPDAPSQAGQQDNVGDDAPESTAETASATAKGGKSSGPVGGKDAAPNEPAE